MIATRTLWKLALTGVICLSLIWMIPFGMPIGFVPIAEIGVGLYWAAWWDRELRRREAAELERFLAEIQRR